GTSRLIPSNAATGPNHLVSPSAQITASTRSPPSEVITPRGRGRRGGGRMDRDRGGLHSDGRSQRAAAVALAGGKYVGTAVAARLFVTVIFPQDRTYRLIPTRTNGQPAFGVYVLDPATGVFHVNGLLVLTLAGDRVRAMTRFD